MGMDPASIALLIGTIGSGVIGGITAPQGQQLQSFHNQSGVNPVELAGEDKGLLSDYLTAVLDRAAQPVTLNTSVAPLPSFVGGGLPMPIAAPAQDPNRTNPALRTTPGIDIPRRSLNVPIPGTARQRDPGTPLPGTTTPPPSRSNPPGSAVPRPSALANPAVMNPADLRDTTGYFNGDQNGGGQDPNASAAAAVQLLLNGANKRSVNV